MKFDLQDWMAKATRMTRNGELRAAADAIRQALKRVQAPAAVQPVPREADVIDMPGAAEPATPAEASAPARRPESRLHRHLHPFATGLAGLGVPFRPAPQPAPARGPADLSMVSGHHADAHDGRDYRLYVPPQAADAGKLLPLVVMLHGCTQGAEDFAAGTAMNGLAHERGFLVLYPEQSARANPQRCWNWFKHSHQQRGRGEPALVAGMVRRVMAEHAVDPARVYIAGLSAGGAMAAIVGAAYPELFAAVGVHSGLAPGAATDLPGALAAMQRGHAPAAGASGVPTIVFHGDADTTVHPSNGAHVVAASAGAAAAAAPERVDLVEAGGRRASTRRVLRGGDGRPAAEHWVVHGAAHAWAGGHPSGSYTDPSGPDATREMMRFFLEHPRRELH